MSRPSDHHWFLDRWCAELVVEQNRTSVQAARIAGVHLGYVMGAINRVYGCGIIAARARAARKREAWRST